VYITGPRIVHKDSYREAFPLIRGFSFDDEHDSSDYDSSDVEDSSCSE
jgi:hypothetical protein